MNTDTNTDTNIKFTVKVEDMSYNRVKELSVAIDYINENINTIIEENYSIRIWGKCRAMYEYILAGFEISIHYDLVKGNYENINVSINEK